MIPKTYSEWRHCITVACGLELTPEYIARRLESLQNKELQETQTFIKKYGEEHWRNVQGFFRQAQQTT
jgi:3-dehydroquinate synthetase